MKINMTNQGTLLLIITTFLTITTLLILLQTLTLRSSFLYSPPCDLEVNKTRSKLQEMITFLPLKDLRYTHTTWFMSSINDIQEKDQAHHLYFPSKGKILCLLGHDPSNGANNSYALTWPEVLPAGARLLSGLTFVSETFYDYINLWHGLSAMTPFVNWYQSKHCMVPERWVLFHWGELRLGMTPWLETLMEVSIGRKMKIEKFNDGGDRPVCFEKAVVFRRNEEGMSKTNKEKVYDLMRCKARAYCNVGRDEGGGGGDDHGMEQEKKKKVIRLTLFFRVGSRSFKNETEVVAVSGEQCRKFDGCRLRVAHSHNLSFCDQVRLMSDTDILITPHGAQLTNMIFMDKNSSLMEFFPKGWLELAGVGQYVFRWLTDWAGLRHEGAWNDPNGQKCPYSDDAQCFTFYKDGKIGIDEDFLGKWLARVLNEVKEHKIKGQANLSSSVCSCSSV
ncbi:putative glycosyltransferase 61 [Dioscorea sansibarensis]